MRVCVHPSSFFIPFTLILFSRLLSLSLSFRHIFHETLYATFILLARALRISMHFRQMGKCIFRHSHTHTLAPNSSIPNQRWLLSP